MFTPFSVAVTTGFGGCTLIFETFSMEYEYTVVRVYDFNRSKPTKVVVVKEENVYALCLCVLKTIERDENSNE